MPEAMVTEAMVTAGDGSDGDPKNDDANNGDFSKDMTVDTASAGARRRSLVRP